MTTAEHLRHLIWLMEPPFTESWKRYAWARAQEIAQDPEHSDLPRLLEEAMRAKATSTTGEETP